MLVVSSPILKVLAKHAENGYPELGSMKAVWVSLDLDRGILETRVGGQFNAARRCVHSMRFFSSRASLRPV